MSYLPEISKKFILYFFVMAASNSFADNELVFDSDVEILKSDQSGISFRYTVPEPTYGDFEINNSTFRTLEIDRAAQIRIDGRALIPEKIVPLG
jgi:hypothetical protein